MGFARRDKVQVAAYLLEYFIYQVFVNATMEVAEKCLEHFLVWDLVHLNKLVVYKND